ncbi:TPA: hypothetical protein ACP32N_006536 [Pseudomonas aeruginosa]
MTSPGLAEHLHSGIESQRAHGKMSSINKKGNLHAPLRYSAATGWLNAAGTAFADDISEVFGNVPPPIRARLETLKNMGDRVKVNKAETLYQAYSTNEFAADKEFKDKYIVVAGVVTGLSRAPKSDQPVIHHNGLPLEMYYPQEVLAELFEVQLGKSSEGKPALQPATDRAALINKGQEAVMQCKVTGKYRDHCVAVDQCFVLQVNPQKKR